MADDKMKAACEPGTAPSLVMTGAGAPTLAMLQLLDTNGNPPLRVPTNQGAQISMGMVHSFAGNYAAYNAPPCRGQTLDASNNTQLELILGLSYGGNGEPYFNLPNLNNRVAAGGTPVGTVTGNALTMTYMIVAQAMGWSAFPTVGMIGLFAGDFAPSAWLVADGSSVSVNDQRDLFQMIGYSFGGSGGSFSLPDLRGRSVIGAGAGPGRAPVAFGEVVEGAPGAAAGLGLTWLIATEGEFPAREGGNSAFPTDQQTIGEIRAFAGPGLPDYVRGYALCDGSVLPIANHLELYAVLLDRYGGDGINTFALPDLRGLMLAGSPA